MTTYIIIIDNFIDAVRYTITATEHGAHVRKVTPRMVGFEIEMDATEEQRRNIDWNYKK